MTDESRLLDGVRKALAPSTLRTELEGIEAELADLEAKLEVKRQDLGAAHRAVSHHTPGGGHETRLREVAAAHALLAAECKALRTRRRRILELLRPPSQVRETVAGVAIPKALQELTDELEQVRQSRQALQHKVAASGKAKLDPAIADQLAAYEERIRALRTRRAELQAPFEKAVREALRPLEVEQAERLLAAAREFIAAVSMISEIASEKPPHEIRDYGNGLEGIANISTYPAHQAIDFAERVLIGVPK